MISSALSKADDVIGVVGVGEMGEGIGNSMLRAGWQVLVYDIRPEGVERLVAQGAQQAESLEDLARRSSVIAIVVVDDLQVRSVVRSVVGGLRRGAVVMVNSTVLPSTVQELASEVGMVGAALIDAGVAGGAEKSNLGTLTVMVGGSDEAVTRVWPVIEAFSATPFHVGPVGSGVAAKLVNNVLSLAGYALLLEAMKLGAAYGLDEETITEVVTLSGGDSRMIRTWGRFDRLRREHAHNNAVRYDFFSKDVREAAVAGGERQLILPLISTAGLLLPRLLAERDEFLAEKEPEELPRCYLCNQELSKSFRARGVHPECKFWAEG